MAYLLKNNYFLAGLIGIGFAVTSFFSCEEVVPPLFAEAVVIDSTYVDPVIPAAQSRIVLLEDFSGVQCVNCPQANMKAAAIAASNPDNVAVVTLHNYFVGAYAFSDEDFRNQESYDIDALLGPTTSWPIGAVNRTQFPSEGAVLLDDDKWAAFVDIDKVLPPIVNVSVEATRSGTVITAIINMHFLEEVTGDLALSVMLLESDIEDPQLTGSGVDTFYIHEHVLRTMPTPSIGSPISETTEAGRVIIRGYEIELEPHWNTENLEVLSFVHRSGVTDKSVLQVAHKTVN
ncbi:MAG: hypothetical protein ACI959_001107 [Limisphaerales bacterium]|jgi:hypothetical protein